MSRKTWMRSFRNSLILLWWINKGALFSRKYCKNRSVRYQTTQALNICNWLDKLQNPNQLPPRRGNSDFWSWWPQRTEEKRPLTRSTQAISAHSHSARSSRKRLHSFEWGSEQMTCRGSFQPFCDSFSECTRCLQVRLPFKPSPYGPNSQSLLQTFFQAMLYHPELHASRYNFARNFCCSGMRAFSILWDTKIKVDITL